MRNESSRSACTVVLGMWFAVLTAAEGPANDAGPHCLTPPSGLVSWWPGGGNSNDVVSDHHGTENGVTFVSGEVGKAFMFDGTNEVTTPAITLGAGPAATPFTVDLWIYPQNYLASYQQVVRDNLDGSHYGILYFHAGNTGGYLDYWQGSQRRAMTGTVFAPYFAWSHVALTYDGSIARIYVNGTEDASSDPYTEVFDQPLTIGDAPGSAAGNYGGRIDEVQVFDRALTQPEIQAIIDARSLGQCGRECTPSPYGMVSWWTGDADASDLADGGNHASLVNGATLAAAKVGRSFSLDGSNDIVQAPDAATLRPQVLSAAAWVRASGVGPINDGEGPVVFSKDTSSAGGGVSYGILGPGNTGKFNAYVRFANGSEPAAVSTGSFAFGAWHHVAETWDGSKLSLYVDGNLEGSTNAGAGAITYTTDPFGIGRHSLFGGARGLPGLVDEVQLWERALAPGEVAALHRASGAGACKPASGFIFGDGFESGTVHAWSNAS